MKLLWESIVRISCFLHRILVVNGHDDIMIPAAFRSSFSRSLATTKGSFSFWILGMARIQFPEEFAEAAARLLAAD
jgi:hypothetical protein